MLHSFGANQGFVVSGDSCLVVDSGFHNRTALQILHRVRKLRPKRIMLVNTHYHSDHVLGNSVFAHKGPGVLSHVGEFRRSSRGTVREALSRILRPIVWEVISFHFDARVVTLGA